MWNSLRQGGRPSGAVGGKPRCQLGVPAHSTIDQQGVNQQFDMGDEGSGFRKYVDETTYQNLNAGPKLTSSRFMIPPLSTTTQPPTHTNF